MSFLCLSPDNVYSVSVADLVVVVDAVKRIAVYRLTHAGAFGSVFGAAAIAFAEVFAVYLLGKSGVVSAYLNIAQTTTVIFVVNASLRIT